MKDDLVKRIRDEVVKPSIRESVEVDEDYGTAHVGVDFTDFLRNLRDFYLLSGGTDASWRKLVKDFLEEDV